MKDKTLLPCPLILLYVQYAGMFLILRKKKKNSLEASCGVMLVVERILYASKEAQTEEEEEESRESLKGWKSYERKS